MIEPWSWSYSSLAEFEICPMKMAAQRFYKTVKQQDTEATIWGKRVHTAAEQAMKHQHIEDTEAFKVVEPWINVLWKHPGARFIEEMFCLNDWKLVDGRENAECTAFVDLGLMHKDKLDIYDYKTGRMKDDITQLKFYCLLFALKHPHLQKFNAKYIWLKENRTTGFEMERKDLVPVFAELKERVARMKQAYDTENFVAKRNGLCRKWCAVYDCPYCGE